MTLQEILLQDKISIRTLNVCYANGLTSIDLLLSYYSKNSDFKSIKNCGRKSNEELLRLCEKYNSVQSSNELKLKFSIVDIKGRIEEMDSQMKGKINRFITENFMKLPKGCRIHLRKILKSNFDVNNFCKLLILNNDIEVFKTGKNKPLLSEKMIFFVELVRNKIIESNSVHFVEENSSRDGNAKILNIYQWSLVEAFIVLNQNQLSKRSKKIISNFLNVQLSKNEEIYVDIKNESDKLIKIGEFTSSELIKFYSSLDKYINVICNGYFEKESKLLGNKVFLTNFFSNQKMKKEFYPPISIFNIVESLINNNHIFKKEIKNQFFRLSFNIFNNSTYFDEQFIVKKLCVSRNSFKLLKKECFEELEVKFNFIKIFQTEVMSELEIAKSNKVVIIDSLLLTKIKEKSKNSFSDIFLIFLLKLIFSNKYDLIGYSKEKLMTCPDKFQNLNRNTYLVEKKYTSYLKFDELLNHFRSELISSKHKSAKTNIKFFIKNHLEAFTNVVPEMDILVFENILLHESAVEIVNKDHTIDSFN